jgi:hypothetical protein
VKGERREEKRPFDLARAPPGVGLGVSFEEGRGERRCDLVAATLFSVEGEGETWLRIRGESLRNRADFGDFESTAGRRPGRERRGHRRGGGTDRWCVSMMVS